MRLYCKCGHRFVLTVCKSIPDRPPLDCNADCWKHQRDSRLATAFSSSKDFEEHKATLTKVEYYPEEALDFAAKFPKFCQKVEGLLTEVVLQRSSRSFVNLTSAKRNFLTMSVYEHFKLDMCTYGGKGTATKAVTDVFWKEGCRVPEILASEVVSLIEKGLMSADHEATKSEIFEATMVVSGIPKGSSLDDIKKLLTAFANEYYPERKGPSSQGHPVYLHFYKKVRAKEALEVLRTAAHTFGNVEVISHRKEIGANPNSITDDAVYFAEEPAKRIRGARHGPVDDDGFAVVRKN